ncbi:MAG: hypothetical protein KBG07_05500 [Elusimicrobia bacterium]|nr:hypothetical protein [Elusimicrobiota bacterium]
MRGIVGVCVLLLCAVSNARAATEPDFYKEGRAAFDTGDYLAAVDHLTEALLHSPGDARCQALLVASGKKLIETRSFSKLSLDELQKLVDNASRELETRRHDLRRALGELKAAQRASEKGSAQEALRACRGVDMLLEVTLGDDPESQKVLEYVRSVCANLEASLASGVLVRPFDERRVAGYVAFCRSDWNEAAEAWGQAAAMAPRDSHLKDLWETAKKRRDREEEQKREEARRKQAERDHMRSLAEQKEYMDRHRRLAVDHQDNGQWVEAAQSWLAVLKVDPLDPQAKEALDNVGEQLRRQGFGSEHAEEKTTGDPAQAERFYTLGLIRYADGDLNGAADSFGAALKRNARHPYARKALERVREEQKPIR